MSRSIPTEDRISTLPDQILCHILSLLPTKFAATTSVLSKRWNPLWLFVENLHFDDQDFETEATFRDFVSCVFLLRDIMVPLRSFHLKYLDTRSFYQRDLSRFIHAAVQRREIENLNLNMPYSYCFNLKLPPSIFSCKTLVVLQLTGIQLHDLSHVVVDLPRLKTLHFSTHQIKIPLYFSPKPFQRFDYLSKLLIGCPAIEEFHAPLNMKYLNLNDKVSMNHNLTNVEFILKNNHYKKWECLLEVLKHCPKLQNLTIHEDSWFINEDNLRSPTINSKVLNTMSIKSLSSLPFSLKRKMIEKLASSTRASTTCKLLIV
ncbi:hypothetical protein P8452_59652 [Trifolium repens]|nr:hypothetical protein P8452_59652 [Trifolium repens]